MLIGIVPGTCGPGHAQHARASALARNDFELVLAGNLIFRPF